MDFRRNKPIGLKTRKLNSQLNVFKDRYLTFTSLVKIILPILLVLVVTPIGLVYLVNITYQRRTISTESEIPLELRTGVVMLKQSDILYDFENSKQIINLVKDLYSKKRVTQVLVISYNQEDNIVSSAEPFQQFFKDIPSDSYKIDVSADSPEQACLLIKEKYNVQKFIMSSYRNLLPRLSYACSFKELYVKPYLPKEFTAVSKEDDFNNTLNIILHSIFGE